MNGEEKNSIEKVENLIKRCDECKLKECINCETNYTEITSIKRIVGSYKRVLKENEQLRTKVNSLKKENEYYKECLEVVSKHLDNIDYDQILFAIYEYYISKQKVKDKIEEYKNILKTCNKAQYIDRIKAINERVLELQELLESEE